MEVRSRDRIIRGLSGRMGDFMFRTYKDGRIRVYYKPKGENTPIMDQQWTDNGPIMDRLRSILQSLNMEIVERDKV